MPDTGKRIVADCRKFPSEKNCQFTISADKSEEEELVDVSVHHAITHHGHQDSPELREEIKKTITEESTP
jgi:predicted small metal-binding protein